MKINENIKLDFKDVLLVPQRSGLSSRSEVDIHRTFDFPHSNSTWTGFPLIAANMDTVGTFQMANALSKHKALTALHKHYSVEELISFFSVLQENVFYTVGISKDDELKLDEVYNKVPNGNINKLNIDVANGYTDNFVQKIKHYRRKYPEMVIMAGNVVTPNMAEELIISGADIVKVGIGGGCFTKDSVVLTKNGLKNINQIDIGEEVLTHRNRYKRVVGTLKKEEKDLISINGIKCTRNHEFYVLNKDIISNKNIEEHAEWISAENLNKNYYLLKNSYIKQYELIEIEEICQVENKDDCVYDIQVEDDHSYNINGIVVHNSVCKTRIVAGVGVPQLSAVSDCSFAVHGNPNGHVCSDGGCTSAGDVAKAFAAGGDFVMIGGMLSGTDECSGEWEYGYEMTNSDPPMITGNLVKKYLKFYGMSSEDAQIKYNGGLSKHRASEGKTVKVPYKGPVTNIILDIAGGVRSACTYIGAKRLKDMPKCAEFVRVNNTHNTVFGN